MRRRGLLALIAGSTGLAGCRGMTAPGTSETPEGTSTATATETETPTPVNESLLKERDPPSPEDLPTAARPAPREPADATGETVPPLSYPERPTNYTSDTVSEFVQAYEHAYRRNELLTENGATLIGQGLHPDWYRTLAVAEDAAVERMYYRYSTSIREGDGIVETDLAALVTYYVDDSVVVRAVLDRSSPKDRRNEDALVPDPWESGVILEPTE